MSLLAMNRIGRPAGTWISFGSLPTRGEAKAFEGPEPTTAARRNTRNSRSSGGAVQPHTPTNSFCFIAALFMMWSKAHRTTVLLKKVLYPSVLHCTCRCLNALSACLGESLAYYRTRRDRSAWFLAIRHIHEGDRGVSRSFS